MNAQDLASFSTRALRGHRLRSSLSLVGVAIGVTSVILLTSLGEGARLYVVGEFTTLGTNLLIIMPGKTETTGFAPVFGGAPHDLTLDDAEAVLRRVRQVRRVAPTVLGSAKARFGERARDVTVIGTTPDFLPIRQIHIQIGRYLPTGTFGQGGRVCVIGARVQEELFGATNPLGEMLRLGDERYRVIGVTVPRGTSLGTNVDEIVTIPVAEAMRMFDQRSLFRLLVDVNSRDEMDAAKAAAVKVLAERHDNVDDVTVLTQDSVLSTFTRILAILTAVLAGIAAISLTVAGVGIMNVMLVSVSERTREIGLLKAIGASRRQVLAVFLVEAAILSTAGGLVGLATALGIARLAGALYPAFPIEAPRWAIVAAILVSISVGMIFGALPARRASRLDPVAALARR